MAITPKLMTWQELADLPDDGLRHELVRGVLLTMAPPFFPHGRQANRLHLSLGPYVQSHGLGEAFASEFGYRLTSAPDTVRVPDVSFISNERLATAGDVRGYFPGSPDLVVEVISPNDRLTKVAEKVEWLEHGTQLVFVVNPFGRRVRVHRLGQPIQILGLNDVLDGEDVVPGWSRAVHDLFDQD